jgi:hypothetical protein
MILPNDFDWRAYLKLNPDLGNAGLVNERQARYHYFHYGKKQNRKYKPETELESTLKSNNVYLNLSEKEQSDLKNSIVSFENAFYQNVDKRYKIDYDKLVSSNLDYNDLIKNNCINSISKQGFKTSCVIAFQNRHKMVSENVKLLSLQSEVPAVVLVVSNTKDYDFAKSLESVYNNVFVIIHRNYPLGGKWQAGVNFSKSLNVDGVMILGSDDLLSLSYFENCLIDIDFGKGSSGNGVDLVGNRSWYMIDKSNTLYSLSYKEKVKIFLGGGKMFSKNFLDKVDWVVFKKYLPRHLDDFGYELVEKHGNKMKLINPDNFILSIKGPWEVMNKSENFISTKSSVNYIKMSNEFKINLLDKLKTKNFDALFE